MKNISKILTAIGSASLVTGLSGPLALAQDEDWDMAGFVENATFYRDGPGLSKSRNTAQFEFSKDMGNKMGMSNFRVSGTLRATYDAVYNLNDDE